MTRAGARRQQCVLFDWGDTVMRVFPECSGPMELWPRTEAMPGIEEALGAVRRDALVCLATNAVDSDERAIRTALARVRLERYFDHVFCYDVVGAHKPSDAFFQYILQELGLDSSSVFMVGDDFQTDIVGANASGIRAVWLNRGKQEDRDGALHTTISSFVTVIGALQSVGFRRDDG